MAIKIPAGHGFVLLILQAAVKTEKVIWKWVGKQGPLDWRTRRRLYRLMADEGVIVKRPPVPPAIKIPKIKSAPLDWWVGLGDELASVVKRSEVDKASREVWHRSKTVAKALGKLATRGAQSVKQRAVAIQTWPQRVNTRLEQKKSKAEQKIQKLATGAQEVERVAHKLGDWAERQQAKIDRRRGQH
ncbi:hypothetical protein HY346_00750 [Candidatus Microgenomates bacterium]|nr:hypothetical protein [Candidatus Microgenomates bacterium]